MTFTESAAPAVVECVFMDGRVASPTECDCQDCLVVTRRMRESAKSLNETAESSFGQMINASATPATAMAAGTPKKISKKLMYQANRKWKKPLVTGG